MWLLFTMTDGRLGIAHESDIKSAAAHPDHSVIKVSFRDGSLDEIIGARCFDSLFEAMGQLFAAAKPRACRVCGCTDDDCSQCVEKTGEPCSWVEADLCSACARDRYTQTLLTKICPHCSKHIGDNIFDCPACGKPLDAPPTEAVNPVMFMDRLRDCPTCNQPWEDCPCTATPEQQLGTDAASKAILGEPESTAAKIAREMREGTAVFVSADELERRKKAMAEDNARMAADGYEILSVLDEYELPIGALKLSNPMGAMWRVLRWDGEAWKLGSYRESYPSREAAQRAIVYRGEYWRVVGDRQFEPWKNSAGQTFVHKPWPDDHGVTLAQIHVETGKMVARGDASCIPQDWPAPGCPSVGPIEE